MPHELRAFYDPVPHIHKAVVEALAPLNDRRTLEPLVKLFRGNEPYGPNFEVFQAATNVLRQMGGVRTCDFRELSDLLKSDDSVTRIATALSLLWLVDERAVELLRMTIKDRDSLVRHAAKWSAVALDTVLSYGIASRPSSLVIQMMLK